MVIKPQALARYLSQHLHQTLYSTGYFLALSAIVPAVAGYVFWGVSARLVNVEQVGIASALVSVTAFLTLLSGLDLGTLLIRYLPGETQPTRLINTTLILRIALAAIASVIFLMGISLWSPAQSFLVKSPLVALAFVLANVFQSINELIVHIFVVYRRPRLALLKNVYVALIRFPILAVALVWFKPVDGISIYFVTMFGVLLSLVWAFWKMLPAANPGYRFRLEFARFQVRRLFRFSALNYVGELALQIPLLLTPVIIANQLGNEASGIAYIVLMISSTVAILPQGLARALLSEGAHTPSQVRHNLGRVLILSFLLECVLIVGVLVTGHFVLSLTIGSPQADRGMGFLVLAIITALPMTLVLVYYSLKRIQGQIGAIAVIGTLVCAVSVGLIVLLAPVYGLLGVGIGLLLGQITGAIPALLALISVLRLGHSANARTEQLFVEP